jgi:GntR family transcriptional regulator/MocR family aminotransferase
VRDPITIDPDSTLPRHRQVYEAIRAAILAGELEPGARLPATRSLADGLALARATVAEAYEQLRAEGYIRGRHGSGTFVAPDLPADGGGGGGGGGPLLRGSALRNTGPGRRLEAGEDGSVAKPRLSRWGQRIAANDFLPVMPPTQTAGFRYDFRPHRIAPDVFPWDAWRSSVEYALATDRGRMLAYPPTAGHPDLQQAIAAHVERYRGVVCDPGQIVVVNGTQQGLNLLTELLLDPDDPVAVEDPGYPAARRALEAWGLRVARVRVDGEGMIVDELAAAGPQRLIHVTPSHQDPTGATLSLARRLALLELAERHRAVVVEDDYDSEFRYEGRPVESLKGLDRHDLVVHAGTFSKSVLSSLRLGFLILPRPLVRPFTAAKALWDGGTPLLEQAALARFMQTGELEKHIRKMRRLYRARRDALVMALQEEFGEQVMVGERHGGLNMLVGLNAAIPEDELVRVATEGGVGLRGAASYYSEPPRRPTFLMGFAALPEGEMREGVAALAAAARHLLNMGLIAQ